MTILNNNQFDEDAYASKYTQHLSGLWEGMMEDAEAEFYDEQYLTEMKNLESASYQDLKDLVESDIYTRWVTRTMNKGDK